MNYAITQGLLVFLAVAQAADWYTTYRGIKAGSGRESNVLLNRYALWLATHGHTGRWVWLTSSKLLAVAVIGWIMWVLPQDVPDYLMYGFAVLSAMYAYVIWKNYSIYARP